LRGDSHYPCLLPIPDPTFEEGPFNRTRLTRFRSPSFTGLLPPVLLLSNLCQRFPLVCPIIFFPSHSLLSISLVGTELPFPASKVPIEEQTPPLSALLYLLLPGLGAVSPRFACFSPCIDLRGKTAHCLIPYPSRLPSFRSLPFSLTRSIRQLRFFLTCWRFQAAPRCSFAPGTSWASHRFSSRFFSKPFSSFVLQFFGKTAKSFLALDCIKKSFLLPTVAPPLLPFFFLPLKRL